MLAGCRGPEPNPTPTAHAAAVLSGVTLTDTVDGRRVATLSAARLEVGGDRQHFTARQPEVRFFAGDAGDQELGHARAPFGAYDATTHQVALRGGVHGEFAFAGNPWGQRAVNKVGRP